MEENNHCYQNIKEILGKKAASIIEDGMVVGLGSGSTATCFIEALGQRIANEKLSITAASSSEKSKTLARQLHIPVLDEATVSQVDLTVDGADAVLKNHILIKGHGGAHFREKLLAFCSKKVLILVDETKLVNSFQGIYLPVEVVPFLIESTIHRIQNLGYQGSLRKNKDGSLFITDNQNYLFDLTSTNNFADPKQDHAQLIQIPGVCETGFFFDLELEIWVGYKDEKIAPL